MSAAPIFRRILVWGGFLALAIIVVGGGIGFLAAGTPGIVSALLGTAMSVLFMGITAGSILLALKVSGDPVSLATFFGIVTGGWLAKIIAFLVIVFSLKNQPWIDPTVLFVTIVAGVLGSLVIDLVVVARSRLSYVSDVSLPTDDSSQD